MTTSGSYDNTTSMSNIVNDAFTLINAHDGGETLPADKWDTGKRRLNQLMNYLSIHRGLWMVTTVTHTLTPGTASYTIGSSQTINTPKPMEVISAYRTVSSTDIPMDVASRDDYENVTNKTLQSSPLMVYYDQGRDTGTLYVWPTGTSTDKYLTIKTHRPIQDFDDEGNNPDLPREWVLLITYMLAELLAPQYLGGVVPQDITRVKNEMLISLMNYDEEKTSIIFAV